MYAFVQSYCRFQRAIAEKLKPIHVDPEDKSWKAFFTRARNSALAGVNHDIHDEISDDTNLTAVCCALVMIMGGRTFVRDGVAQQPECSPCRIVQAYRFHPLDGLSCCDMWLSLVWLELLLY